MMHTYRLVRMIETHSDSLAAGLLEKVRNCPVLMNYRNVPAEDLEGRVYEIYSHLGDWLVSKNEHDIELRYREIGARRAVQRVPLSELIWAIVLTKENLWEFLDKEAVMDRPVEAFGELEVSRLLEQFFDRAQYYAAVGYERTCAAQALLEPSAAR
jgi:hypothetical protein